MEGRLSGLSFPEVVGFEKEAIQHTFIIPREGQPVLPGGGL